MLKNISDKDKKLLVFMFIVVIVAVFGYWGVYPQIKAFNKLAPKIEAEELKAEVNQIKAANAIFVADIANDYAEQIEKEKATFYPMMKSSEVDKMMTDLARESNLVVYDLNFSMPTSPSSREPYIYSELHDIQAAKRNDYMQQDILTTSETEDDIASLTGGSKEKKDSKKKKDLDDEIEVVDTNVDIFGNVDAYQPNTDIYAVPVSITVGGRTTDLDKFIDKIINMDKRILLISYAWGEYRVTVSHDEEGNIVYNNLLDDVTEEDQLGTLNVTMEIYMYNDESAAENVTEEGNENGDEAE